MLRHPWRRTHVSILRNIVKKWASANRFAVFGENLKMRRIPTLKHTNNVKSLWFCTQSRLFRFLPQRAARLGQIPTLPSRTRPWAPPGRDIVWDRGLQSGGRHLILAYDCLFIYVFMLCLCCVSRLLLFLYLQTLSLFPPRILKVLEFAGFSGDKVWRVAFLYRVFDQGRAAQSPHGEKVNRKRDVRFSS